MDSPDTSASAAEPTAQSKVKAWTNHVVRRTNRIVKERLEAEFDLSDSDSSEQRWKHVSAKLKKEGIDRSPNTVKARYRSLIVDVPVYVSDGHKSREVSFPTTRAKQQKRIECHHSN
jgi:hypothetical protein